MIFPPWAGERLPFEPLLEGRTMRQAALRLRCDVAHVSRELRGPGITPWSADRFAGRLAQHPSEVWGDEWWKLDPNPDDMATDEEIAASAAEDPFVLAVFRAAGILPTPPVPPVVKRRRRGAPNRWR